MKTVCEPIQGGRSAFPVQAGNSPPAEPRANPRGCVFWCTCGRLAPVQQAAAAQQLHNTTEKCKFPESESDNSRSRPASKSREQLMEAGWLLWPSCCCLPVSRQRPPVALGCCVVALCQPWRCCPCARAPPGSSVKLQRLLTVFKRNPLNQLEVSSVSSTGRNPRPFISAGVRSHHPRPGARTGLLIGGSACASG